MCVFYFFKRLPSCEAIYEVSWELHSINRGVGAFSGQGAPHEVTTALRSFGNPWRRLTSSDSQRR